MHMLTPVIHAGKQIVTQYNVHASQNNIIWIWHIAIRDTASHISIYYPAHAYTWKKAVEVTVVHMLMPRKQFKEISLL